MPSSLYNTQMVLNPRVDTPPNMQPDGSLDFELNNSTLNNNSIVILMNE